MSDSHQPQMAQNGTPVRAAKMIELAGDPNGACDEFEGSQPSCVIVDIGHDHEFVGARFGNERIDTRTNRIGRANDGASEHAHCLRFFRRRPVAFNVVDRWLAEAASAAEDIRKGHLLRRRQPTRCLIAASSLLAAMMLTPTMV